MSAIDKITGAIGEAFSGNTSKVSKTIETVEQSVPKIADDIVDKAANEAISAQGKAALAMQDVAQKINVPELTPLQKEIESYNQFLDKMYQVSVSSKITTKDDIPFFSSRALPYQDVRAIARTADSIDAYKMALNSLVFGDMDIDDLVATKKLALKSSSPSYKQLAQDYISDVNNELENRFLQSKFANISEDEVQEAFAKKSAMEYMPSVASAKSHDYDTVKIDDITRKTYLKEKYADKLQEYKENKYWKSGLAEKSAEESARAIMDLNPVSVNKFDLEEKYSLVREAKAKYGLTYSQGMLYSKLRAKFPGAEDEFLANISRWNKDYIAQLLSSEGNDITAVMNAVWEKNRM